MQLDRQGKQEQIPKNGVYEKDGKWFMRFDDKSDGAEIPGDMARVIKIALLTERRAGRVIHRSINCHQTAFRSIGLVRSGEKLPGSYAFRLFPKDVFKEFAAVDELTSYIRNATRGKIGLVQIAHQINWDLVNPVLVHSFIAGADSTGRVICFEKVGHNLEFRITPINAIYSHLFRYENQILSYSNQLWAAGPVDEIKENPSSQWVRKNVVNGSSLDTDDDGDNNRALHGSAQ